MLVKKSREGIERTFFFHIEIAECNTDNIQLGRCRHVDSVVHVRLVSLVASAVVEGRDGPGEGSIGGGTQVYGDFFRVVRDPDSLVFQRKIIGGFLSDSGCCKGC